MIVEIDAQLTQKIRYQDSDHDPDDDFHTVTTLFRNKKSYILMV